jgi:transposase, IS30 family
MGLSTVQLLNQTMPIIHRHLCQSDRSTIQDLLKRGLNQSEIAEAIEVHPSTVSRELRRNTGQRGYRSKQAGHLATARKVTQRRRRKITGDVAQEVESRLRELHSPEQISGAMAKEGLVAQSHETIYRYIVLDKKAGGALFAYLRINGTRRYRRRVKGPRSKIPGRVDINQRPFSIESRRYFGDWEIDLVEGSKGTGFILSMVERKSRYSIFEKLGNKKAATVSDAMIRRLWPFKTRSLTYDNGLEFAGHLEVGRELGAKGYFCTPYHSWEKGLVENHNGLLRQYYPKGSSFETINERSIAQVEEQINDRPRKLLEYASPMDYLNRLTAA